MDIFGCCSRYLECSNTKQCLYSSDPEYAGCGYRRNLEAGRIFYDENAFAVISEEIAKQDEKASEPKIERQNTSIFLYCFDRLFAVRSKQKDLSYNLTPEQAEKVENAFADAGIPHKLQIESVTECIIDYPTDEDPAPANSRVVFEIDEEEYHLLNYNTWLIKKRIAEKIVKAFDNHYINARLELRGQYSNIDKVKLSIPERRHEIVAEIISRPKPQISTDVKQISQVSIFDINTQPCNEIPVAGVEIQKIIQLPTAIENRWGEISVESTVVATDTYWGTYRGVLTGTYNKVLSDIKMAKVRIIEMLVPPRQHAILDPYAPYPRDPYPVDSEQVFYLSEVKMEESTHENLSAAG